MKVRPSITDVATRAGVSIKTVSRVINDELSVLPGTRYRVEQSILELGYIPNSMARMLKSGVTDAIGVVIDTIADPFFASLVSVIEDRAIEHGLSVVFASAGLDAEREHDQLLRMAGNQVRGIILSPVSQEYEYLERYRHRMPVVMVDRRAQNFDSIVVDDIAATQEGIEQFIGFGHTRIAFVGNDTRFSTLNARVTSYQHTLRNAGIDTDPGLCPPCRAEVNDCYEATARILAQPRPPTAIFAGNARAGIGAASAIHEHCQSNVALISFGNFALSSVLKPSVTYIDHSPELMANAAVARLADLLDSCADGPRDILVPTTLVRCGSGEIPNRQDAAKVLGKLAVPARTLQ